MHFKVKVGASPEDDYKRVGRGAKLSARSHADDRRETTLGRPGAIDRVRALSKFNLLGSQEPTSPDDVLGHGYRARGGAGRCCARASIARIACCSSNCCRPRRFSFCQSTAAGWWRQREPRGDPDGREVRRAGVSACGGVGLCELVQHLSMFDCIAVSGTTENRVTEFVDHLHEHFVDPVAIENARYMPPLSPGYSAEIKPESRRPIVPTGEALAKLLLLSLALGLGPTGRPAATSRSSPGILW